jgi:hypothetical protein
MEAVTRQLSFAHHRALARLDTTDQRQWIAASLAENDAGRRMSVLRLRRSIEVGRVLTSAELQADPADAGIVNHIPFVNRLVGCWGRMRAEGWLAQDGNQGAARRTQTRSSTHHRHQRRTMTTDTDLEQQKALDHIRELMSAHWREARTPRTTTANLASASK